MELWLFAFFQIIIINIILSGDNALVIAMASRNLPEAQRRLAVFWGAVGAIGLRVILTIIAIQLLQFPYVMAIGSVLLVWVAIKLISDDSKHDENANVQAATGLTTVVMTIIMADFVMSLDNVIAIAAVAHGDMVLILIGLALSIPVIVWGSTIVLKLLDRFPLLVYAGAAILGFTAGEMIMKDPAVSSWVLSVIHISHTILATVTGFAVVLCGWLLNKVRYRFPGH
jgi:YjbE family integral membrane protein